MSVLTTLSSPGLQESLAYYQANRRAQPLKEIPGFEEVPDRLMLKKIVREGFLEFCMAMMPNWVPSKFHIFLANQLQEAYFKVKAGIEVRMMVEIPPQHGKSTMISVLFPAWVLSLEDWPIICASYGSALAERKSQECRDVILSKIYKQLTNTRLHADSTSKEFWQTSSKGSYRAAGVGSALTGMTGKLILVDDPFKDRQDADSMTIRETTWKWWQSTLYTRRQGIVGIILLNTRWHMDDLSGRLLEQQDGNVRAGIPDNQYDHWERIRFPALAEGDEYMAGKLFRKAGEALWPERFSVDNLIKTRNQTDVYEWSSLYQQSPILQENAEFRTEWFRYFEAEDLKTLNLTYYTVVDLAISQKQTADNTVVRTVAKDRTTGKIYLVEETAGRLDPLETIDAIFHHVKTYRSRVWIESVAYQAALQYFVIEEQRKRKFFFDVQELTRKNTASKEGRIRGLIPMYKAGIVYHRHSDGELERELLQFPKGKHDDRIDALSMVQDIVDRTMIDEPDEAPETFDPHSAFQRV